MPNKLTYNEGYSKNDESYLWVIHTVKLHKKILKLSI